MHRRSAHCTLILNDGVAANEDSLWWEGCLGCKSLNAGGTEDDVLDTYVIRPRVETPTVAANCVVWLLPIVSIVSIVTRVGYVRSDAQDGRI